MRTPRPRGSPSRGCANTIALEGQRRDGRVRRLDADAFPAEEQEPRPQEIEQLRRGDQNSERGLRRDALEREADGEVADEHDWAGSILPRHVMRDRAALALACGLTFAAAMPAGQ